MDNVTVEKTINEPIAKLQGETVSELPKDLYIPPDAMRVFLEAFEGPLDLLLYLIRKQNLDILDIPIAEVTTQYVQYIDLMQSLSIELATEYLVIAAILAEIKSRMLLPKPKELESNEEDPRAELIRRLQEYERIKEAATNLDQLPRQERDIYIAQGIPTGITKAKPQPNVSLETLIQAFAEVLKRNNLNANHAIYREPLSVRERMTIILEKLKSQEFIDFSSIFDKNEGRPGVVVSFLAILELFKDHIIDCIQTQPFAPIHLKIVESTKDAC